MIRRKCGIIFFIHAPKTIAKARMAVEKPEAFRRVIVVWTEIQFGSFSVGAVPLINSDLLRRAMTAKPEGEFRVLENIFGQEANP